MRTRISTLLFSNLRNHHHHLPKTSIFAARFSSISTKKPMTSDRRSAAAAAGADRLLHILSSGDEGDKPPPSPIPNSPMRGEAHDFSAAGEAPIKIAHQYQDPVRREPEEKQFRDTLPSPPPPPPSPPPPPQDVDEIFRKMKETGMVPNAVAMLDGLCKDGLVQEAMKLLGLMREKGTIPEVVIYTAVVEGFCKAEKFDDAKRIFRKMQKNGIVPNAYSYMILIQGLCGGGEVEDSVEFCCEMLDAGHWPNAVTFTGLVNGLCKEKGLEEAESVVRRLWEKGFTVDQKAVKDYLDKKVPFSQMAWDAIFGKKRSKRPF